MHTVTSFTLVDLLPSFERSLRARRRSERTIADYTGAARQLEAWLAAQGMPTAVDAIAREHVEAYIVAELERTSPSTAASAYRRLQQVFRWLAEEGEIPASPMARMSPPDLPEAPVPIIDDDRLRRLLAACGGKGFTDRRDHAILRLLIDTGMRRGEVAGLRVADVDWRDQVATVTGKGDKTRHCPFGHKTAEALDRYLRARSKHADSDQPWLWVGRRGRLGDSGIAQMLRRRCAAAGIEPLHLHLFRHTAAHHWLATDGGEGDLMRLMGWSSRDMLDRYGASAADARARDAHRRKRPGDRI